MQGDVGSIPGSVRFPGHDNGYPLQYSCLENSMETRIWCMGSQRVRHDWVTNTFREWLSFSLWPPSTWSSSLHLERAPTIWGSAHLPLKKIKMPNTHFHVSQWLPGSANLLNQLQSGIGDAAPRNWGQVKSILKMEDGCDGSFLQVLRLTTNRMTRASAEDREEFESRWK